MKVTTILSEQTDVEISEVELYEAIKNYIESAGVVIDKKHNITIDFHKVNKEKCPRVYECWQADIRITKHKEL